MNRFTAIVTFCILSLAFIVQPFYKIFFTELPINQFAEEARAFLDGRLDIGHYVHDVSLYDGRYYFVFPPFPAILLMPFVYIFGHDQISAILIALILTVGSVSLLCLILRRLEINPNSIAYLILAFFTGTAYWFEFKESSMSWHFAHVVSVAVLFLAIQEALGKGRALLTGFYLACSFLSRQMTLYAIIFLAVALIENVNNQNLKNRIWLIAKLCLLPLIAVVFCLWLNWMRFDNPFDSGYTHMILGGFFEKRIHEHGLFSVFYVPFNFIYLFLQGFHVNFTGDDLLKINCVDPFGTSLTFASPFVFVAFFAKWKKPLLISAWISIALMVVHTLFYYSNGYFQMNSMRFTLDFMPILILLVALGTKQCNEKIWKGLIIYSIALNIVAALICAFSRHLQ